MSKSATYHVGVTGMMMYEMNSALIAITGAIRNVSLSAKGGIQSSLNSIFTTSAGSWQMPKGPTRFGP